MAARESPGPVGGTGPTLFLIFLRNETQLKLLGHSGLRFAKGYMCIATSTSMGDRDRDWNLRLREAAVSLQESV